MCKSLLDFIIQNKNKDLNFLLNKLHCTINDFINNLKLFKLNLQNVQQLKPYIVTMIYDSILGISNKISEYDTIIDKIKRL